MKKPKLAEEQILFSNALKALSEGGLIYLIAGYIVYIIGFLPSSIPARELPLYWGHSVARFNTETRAVVGWNWLTSLHLGDIVSYSGVAFLSVISILCFIVVLPVFLRKRDRVYSAIAVTQIVVLLLAASGFVSGGH